MSASFKLAFLFLRRDLASSYAKELRLLFIALIVAVTASTAVGFFTDRVRAGLERESHQMLGADLLLTADQPWPSAIVEEIGAHGLQHAQTMTFPSMVFVAGRVQMVDVKAASTHYPLRGRLRIAQARGEADAATDRIPAPGETWLEERLATALSLKVGDTLTLGKAPLQITAILTDEPDRGLNFFNIAPRLLMNEADVASTGLVQVGSRVTYRLLVADDDPQRVEDFRRDLGQHLQRGQRIEDASNARPEIRTVLDRADRFLGLSSLLTVILATVAVALCARRYLQRHLDACAVMRCLGATQSRILKLYLAQFALLGFIATLIGCIAGFAVHFVLYAWLADLLAIPLPMPSARPAGQGMLIGFLLLFGFAAPPLFQLRRVSTLRVLRRELGAPRPAFLGGYALGLFALVALLVWIAADVRLGLYTAGGFIATFTVFILLSRCAVALAARIPRGSRFDWRHGIAGLARRPWASSLQIAALALGFMAILLLTVTRGELMQAWRQATPANAPNRFVINIQPDQKEAVDAFFKQAGFAAELAPMIRGRLSEINGKPVSAAHYDDDQAKRLVEREFNLSARASLPPGNTVLREPRYGRWFNEADLKNPRVASVEERLAKTLGVRVGDRLRFTIAGENVDVEVVGLRKLDWDSMRVNFFVLTPPGLIDEFPRSYITSFYLPPASDSVTARLVETFPNLTVIDVSAIIGQIERIMEQVARAVQFIFLFTLAAGITVLHATLAASFDERRYELAVLRALGARGRQLRNALLAEFAAIGVLAGGVAALGAMAVGIVVARQVFQLEPAIDYGLPFLSMLGGAIIVVPACALGIYRLLKTPPVEALRAAQE